MLILFKINKTEIINCVIRKTLLSIIKQYIMLLSIHRFGFFYSQKLYEDDFKFMENK